MASTSPCPWHQITEQLIQVNATFRSTAWIPLTSSNAYKGGIELIPRSTKLGWLEHQRGDKGPGSQRRDFTKSPQRAQRFQPVQVRTHPGDIILFDQYTLHRSLINKSNLIRWSIDMRYISKGSESGPSWNVVQESCCRRI